MERLELAFADVDELRQTYDDSLRHRRAVAPLAAPCDVLASCELVLIHPTTGDLLVLPARTVAFQEQPPAACLELTCTSGLEEFVMADAEVPPERTAESIQDRLRGMSPHDQRKVARSGELPQRIALERMFGKTVWEALLKNPRLTIPEVARIARKGTLPRPMLDQILDNATWVRAAPVRRALLSNPRLSQAQITRILQLTPKAELKLVGKQLGYPAAVRQAARKLLMNQP